MFSKKLDEKLDQFHLLKHPFYVAWSNGELNREILKDYAEQYYHHVCAFPRYISATHSICPDLNQRQILLSNLIEEESFDHDHPSLWAQFAHALDSKKPEESKPEQFTQDMIDNFFEKARSSYAEGLASLYTYERQVPEVAEVKIDGLKSFYGVTSESGLKFFTVHKDADKEHRVECQSLLDSLSAEEQELASEAALSTANYLWNFLSGICKKHNIPMH